MLNPILSITKHSLSPRTFCSSLLLLTMSIMNGIAAEKGNPVPNEMQGSILFYVSFDQETTAADLSNGDGKDSDANIKEPTTFIPGVYGKAYLPSGKRRPIYGFKDSGITFEKPGSIALWVSPHQWDRDQAESYNFFLVIASEAGQVMIAKTNQQGRGDRLYAHASGGGNSKGTSASCGNTSDWQEGEWHLFVLNWGVDSLEISVDGKDPNRLNVPELKNYGGWVRATLTGYSASRNVALDELMIFDRPLSSQEVSKIYENGIAPK